MNGALAARRPWIGIAIGIAVVRNPAGEWLVSRVVAHEPLMSEKDFVATQAISAVEPPRDGAVRNYGARWLGRRTDGEARARPRVVRGSAVPIRGLARCGRGAWFYGSPRAVA